MKILGLLGMLCATFLIACGGNKQDLVKAERWKTLSIPKDVSVSDEPLFSQFGFVKLETSEACLLEGVWKVLSYRDKIYILSALGSGNIFTFGKDGHFITKLSKGKGPEEIIYPTDIAINQEEETLLVLDSYRSIKAYSLQDEHFVSKTTLDKPYHALSVAGKEILLFDANTQAQSEYYLHTLTEGKDHLKKPFKGKPFLFPDYFNPLSKQEVLVSCIFSDTVYSFNAYNKVLKPYYVFDFEDRGMNTADLFDEVNGLGDYMELATERNLLSGPSSIVCLKEDLFFMLKGKKYYFGAYRNEQVCLHNRLFADLPNIFLCAGRDGDAVIFSMDMPWLIDHFSKNPPKTESGRALQQICKDEDENPVLLFAKF